MTEEGEGPTDQRNIQEADGEQKKGTKDDDSDAYMTADEFCKSHTRL